MKHVFGPYSAFFQHGPSVWFKRVCGEVQRTTTYVYKAGNRVYQLTSPDGEVYRMQSYTQIYDPKLTITDLDTLAERLTLPDGWRYESRLLTEDSELKADGLAYVINDDLGNSYQKILR